MKRFQLNAPLLIILGIYFMLSSCSSKPNSPCKANGSVFADSAALGYFKQFIYDHYDEPLAISEQELDSYLQDSTVFRSLSIKNNFGYELMDDRFDSLLALTLPIAPLPAYKPQNLNLSSTGILFRIYIDKRIFGNKIVEVIDIDKQGGQYRAIKADVQIADTCFIYSPKEFELNCIEVLNKQSIVLTDKVFQDILDFYNALDLDRTAYYQHQTKLICDGFYYSIRKIEASTDKITSISCPSTMNGVFLFCNKVLSYFDVQE